MIYECLQAIHYQKRKKSIHFTMMRAKRCQFIITKNEVRQCWSGPFEILYSYVFLLLGSDFLSYRYLCYVTNSANLLSLAYIVHGYQELLWFLISCTFPFPDKYVVNGYIRLISTLPDMILDSMSLY